MNVFKLNASDFDSLRHYQRALTRFFDGADKLTRKDRNLDPERLSKYLDDRVKVIKLTLAPGFDKPENEIKDRERTHVWLRDSMLWTIEELLSSASSNADRPFVYALRSLLQCSEYAGKVGHDSVTQDCYLTLRNILERACEFAGRGE